MPYVDATQLWTLLVKVCRAGRLKDDQKKCAFNLRTDEASAAHYFQVQRLMYRMKSVASAILCILAVVRSPVPTTEHVTGKNLIPQSYGNVINHRIMYVLLPTSQHFYRTVKCLETRWVVFSQYSLKDEMKCKDTPIADLNIFCDL